MPRLASTAGRLDTGKLTSHHRRVIKPVRQLSPSPRSISTGEKSPVRSISDSLDETTKELPPSPSGQSSESEEDQWLVENIQDVQFSKSGNEIFAVKWKGWSVSKGGLTFEPAENLDNCPDKVDSFLEGRKLMDNVQPVKSEVNALRQLAAEGCEIFSQRLADDCFSGRWLVTVNPARSSVEILANQKRQLASFQDGVIANCFQRQLPPITIANVVDYEGPPFGFTFTLDYTYGEGVPHPSEHPSVGCKCPPDGCTFARGKRDCCPALHDDSADDGPKFPYQPWEDSHGCQKFPRGGRLRLRPGDVIVECNEFCACSTRTQQCGNRVVQMGHQIAMKILKTDDKGWGVFAGAAVPKGGFVTEYFGEIITLAESIKRTASWPHASTLMIDLDFDDSDNCFVMDVSRYGNVARFINHSCDANLVMYPAYIGSQLYQIPRMALFARKPIYEHDELTLDYCGTAGSARSEMSVGSSHSKVFQHNVARHKCLCGSKKCKGLIY